MDSRSLQQNGMSAGLGSLGAGLGSLFGGHGQDPYKAASGIYGQIPGQVSPYFAPYQQAGQDALSKLREQFMGITNDPNAAYNKLAAGYKQSPGYQWQLGQGMNAANNAAAAGGMAGSPQHQQQASTMAEGLANQDFNNYLSQNLGIYNSGLQGLQGLNQQGFGANDQMARIMADLMSQQGQMKFAGQAAQNQSQGSQWGNIFGGLASVLPFLFM